MCCMKKWMMNVCIYRCFWDKKKFKKLVINGYIFWESNFFYFWYYFRFIKNRKIQWIYRWRIELRHVSVLAGTDVLDESSSVVPAARTSSVPASTAADVLILKML